MRRRPVGGLLMALPALVVALVVLGICVAATVREVLRDGYGSVEPPRSHPSDEFDPARPARSRRR